MKKWSGGTLIGTLAVILIVRYSLIPISSQQQSPFNFFGNSSVEGSNVEKASDVQPSQLPEVVSHLKKPHLVSVEGLDDLYSRNILEGFKVKLVWAQMRSLLSRSDSLPGTAEGVREASMAWKDLVATIEQEKMSRVGNGSRRESIMKSKYCPFSVSALNWTSSPNGNILEIPCGLVQDSSVTVVGIPSGHGGSFQIEFIGSQLPGEPSPPIVLHYSVRLQGDNQTEDPVIVQNAWTAERKWGAEERCPNDSTGNLKDEWWINFSIDDPALQNLAIRILGQTCSSSGCERNWSVFEQIHTKIRNRLEQKRLNDLVYTTTFV